MDQAMASNEKRVWPIVYSRNYNVRFMGLEKMHPFDARKWGNVFEYLKKLLNICQENIVCPTEATEEELLMVHTRRYLNSLKWGWNVAAIAEISSLVLLPNLLLQRCYLRPMRYQTHGTLVAGQLAMENGWAINIGGGFHHCSKDKGGGFCPYADITLLVEYFLRLCPDSAKKVMIVDLDAHQGNGHARDFLGNNNVYILDVYNREIYPNDVEAKRAISCRVELRCYTQDDEYLDKVHRSLNSSFTSFHPDLIVYNAGTDVLEGDSLGRLSISPMGVIKRDEIVFKKARDEKIPIVMLTSGGYLRDSAKVIADSIANLYRSGIIKLKDR